MDAEVLADRAAQGRAPTADQAADAEADAFMAPREILDHHPAVGHLQVVVLIGQPIAAGSDHPRSIGHPAGVAADQRRRLAVDLGDARIRREDETLLDPLDGELAGLRRWGGRLRQRGGADAGRQEQRAEHSESRRHDPHLYGSTGRLTLSVVTSPARTCTVLV